MARLNLGTHRDDIAGGAYARSPTPSLRLQAPSRAHMVIAQGRFATGPGR